MCELYLVIALLPFLPPNDIIIEHEMQVKQQVERKVKQSYK